VAAWLKHSDRSARVTWTIACALYLVHVWAAFQFNHGWSHAAAYQHTASQTAQVTGIRWGGGLYFNYVFTAIWIADVSWWWRGLASYRNRSVWINRTIHWFFALMFFNAAVVFATGFVRWFGVAATLALVVTAARSLRS
jgi:hypothetical protein